MTGGWAQINGRNAITWAQKFELDLWYADHWGLWLDAKILALTTDRIEVAAYFEIDGSRYRIQLAISSEEAKITVPRACGVGSR